MYVQISQFGIDKALATVIEEAGIAEAYIREYYRLQGRKVWRVDKNLGNLQESQKFDVIDNFGTKWEIKNDRLVFTTGNIYLEQQAFETSEADKYLILAGKGYVVAKSAITAEFALNAKLTPGGDNDRSLGLLITLERLSEISEAEIIL